MCDPRSNLQEAEDWLKDTLDPNSEDDESQKQDEEDEGQKQEDD